MSVVSGAVKMGRRQAEALMESSCVITRAAEDVVNADASITPGSASTIYSGKCRLRMPEIRSSDVVAAGQTVATQSPVLSLPIVGSEDVRVNDVAIITSTLDTKIVVARVAGMDAQTHATARRISVEVLS